MTDLGAVAGADLLQFTGPAAALIERAYPAGSIVMDRDYLDWVLAPRADLGLEPVAAIVHEGPDLVGFAAAAPMQVALGGAHWPGHIVSFVAVAPSHRGGGLARRLYASLLGELRTQAVGGVVVTFAQSGTAGAALIERCYPEAGWVGTELAPSTPRGILRRRIGRPPGPGEVDGQAFQAVLADDSVTRDRMGHDPRLVARTASGARVLATRTIGGGDAQIGLVDSLPVRLTGAVLAEALAVATAELPPDIEQVMVPSLPDDADPLAAAVGLRRVPGTTWRSWIWSREPGHPLLQARVTGVPIT